MATQKSTSFGKLKRPAGREFRSGTLGEAIDDLYADIDDAFETIELGSAHEPVHLATALTNEMGAEGAALGTVAVNFIASKPADATVLTAVTNGALTIDSVPAVLDSRVLIKGMASSQYDGIYNVTAIGAAGAKYVLTRAQDMNETDDVIDNRTVLVTDGTANGGSIWRVTTKPPVLDTNAIAFTQLTTDLALTGYGVAAIDPAADSIVFIDAGSGSASKKTTVALLTTAQSGSMLVASAGTFDLRSAGLTALGVAGATVLTAAQMLTSLISHVPTGGVNLDPDTAANLDTAAPLAHVGTYFDVIVVNLHATHVITFNGGAVAGWTDVGVMTVPGVTSATFRCLRTGAGAYSAIRIA